MAELPTKAPSKMLYDDTSKACSVMIGDDQVTIGNAKSATFDPHIELTRWNGENSFTIKQDAFVGDAALADNKITLADDSKEFYAYPIDGGLKFGINLLTKPDTNVITFQLEGWEEFNFFFQAPLANVNVDGSSWENNDWGHCERSAEVSGSYAVYHKTKRDYVVGGTNYETGKFGHIYRPRLIDNAGNSVWADLNITDGVYTVTIPQDFLDKAEYPIVSNDTFGYTSVGGTNGNCPAGRFVLVGPFTPAGNGTVQSISWYMQQNSASSRTTFGYYDSTPSARLALTAEGTPPASFNWVTINTTTNPSIANGTNYWIAQQEGVDNCTLKYDTPTTPGIKYDGRTYVSGSLPDPAGSLTDLANYCYSAYITYTGGGATVSIPQTSVTITSAVGTPSVAAISISSVTQTGSTITSVTGIQAVASIQYSSISQSGVTLTISPGVQVIGSKSSTVPQTGATLTFSVGIQVVSAQSIWTKHDPLSGSWSVDMVSTSTWTKKTVSPGGWK